MTVRRLLSEGTVWKGGMNERPVSPRPPHPPAQVKVTDVKQKERILTLAKKELQKIQRKSQKKISKCAADLNSAITAGCDTKSIIALRNKLNRQEREHSKVQEDITTVTEWIGAIKDGY